MLAKGWAGAEQTSTVLDAILPQAVLVQPIRLRLRPALSDPGDDLVLECALEAHADAIVTMNVRDFARATETCGSRISRPGDLVAELRKEEKRATIHFVTMVIAERVGELKAVSHVRARIARADLTRARAVRALVPDRAPMDGDELPT